MNRASRLRTPGMFAGVTAVSGEGLSAASCVAHVERLASWAQIPGMSALWAPRAPVDR